MNTPEREIPSPPHPEQTGSEGGQDRAQPDHAKALIRSDEHSTLKSPFGQVIEEASEIRGVVAMQLAAAGVKQLTSDLENLREELRDVKRERDNWREKFYDERTSRAVLENQLKNQPRMQRFQNVALAAGGLIGGVGIPLLMQAGTTVVGSLLSGAGVVLLWIGASRLRDEDK